jgi:hypothetical protein
VKGVRGKGSVRAYRARVANLLLRAAAGGPLCGSYALSPAAVLGQIAPRPYRCTFGHPIQRERVKKQEERR